MHRRTGFTLIELLVVVSIIALLIALIFPFMANSMKASENVECSNNLRNLINGQLAYAVDHRSEYTSARHWVWGQGAGGHDPTRLDLVKKGLLWDYIRRQEPYLCPVAADLMEFHPSWQNPNLARNYIQSWNTGPNYSDIVSDPPRKHDNWDSEELAVNSITKPRDLVIFAEENWFTIPGWSNYTVNDGLMISAGRAFSDPNGVVDCFGSFHNTRGKDLMTGESNAGFADGHVDWVNYRGTTTFKGKTVRYTTMWVMDRYPVNVSSP